MDRLALVGVVGGNGLSATERNSEFQFRWRAPAVVVLARAGVRELAAQLPDLSEFPSGKPFLVLQLPGSLKAPR